MKTVSKSKNRKRQYFSIALRLLLALLAFAVNFWLVIILSTYVSDNAHLIYIALQVVSFIIALNILNSERTSDYKMIWIFLLLVISVPGLIFYFLWANKGVDKTNISENEIPPNILEVEQFDKSYLSSIRDYPDFCKTIRRLYNSHFYLNSSIKYYSTGEESWQVILEELEKAQDFIFMEFFVVSDGTLLNKVLHVLYDRIENGVEVKLLFDDFGSLKNLHNDTINEMEAHGIRIKKVHPILQSLHRLNVNYRDHRKIVSIDGNTVFTGGINLADEYANIIEKFGYWKDSAIMIHGEVAWEFTKSFMTMWRAFGGDLKHDDDFYRPRIKSQGNGFVVPIFDGPNLRPKTLGEDLYLQMIAEAKESIQITTPYFCIDEPMLKNLCLASSSGVDTRIYLPGRCDHILTDYAGKSYYRTLIKYGVRIFRYNPGLLHQKTLLIDQQMAFVGSINMDYRSFQLHYECGALICGNHEIDSISSDLEDIESKCSEITYANLEKESFISRFLTMFSRIFVAWM